MPYVRSQQRTAADCQKEGDGPTGLHCSEVLQGQVYLKRAPGRSVRGRLPAVPMSSSRRRCVTVGRALAGALVLAGAGRDHLGGQRGRGDNPFPDGTNAAGSLRPSPPATRLFTQDAYTESALLEPGSESFCIRFLPEERVSATELVNATRGGSEGSGIEVYDPRTGQPLTFTYEQDRNDPQKPGLAPGREAAPGKKSSDE